jgi:ornithine--oxo-acid transaminase
VEIDAALVPARVLCERLLARGVLTKDTHDTVIRFTPPLVITRELLEEAVGVIRAVFAEAGAGLPGPS